MIYGLWQNATGMSNALAQQDVISNNLANADTVGFKRLITSFAERQRPGGPGVDDGTLEGMTGGRWMLPTTVDRSMGSLEQTSNPLDVALHGEGFLVVRDGAQTCLTRDGRLAMNQQGQLTLAAQPDVLVMDEEDQPIELGTRAASSLRIDEDGMVRDGVTSEALGKIRLAEAATVRPTGEGLFEFDGPLTPAAETTVAGGFVEQSNVEATRELTRLIEINRLLEANANMIRYQDESLGRLIEAGKIG